MLGQVRLVVIAALAAGHIAASGCGRDDGARTGDRVAAAPPRDPLLEVPLPAGAARVDGNQFHVDVATQPGCAAGATCAVLADLTAAGDFKVNTEYPFKLVPAAGGAVTPTASFALTGTRTGRLIIRFTRPSAAPLPVAGDFKLSVCNLEQCLIEVAPLTVLVD